MADDVQTATPATEPETYGLLAEFATPEELLHAAERVRDEGFSQWDAHTPFPIHGLEKAMGLKRSMVSLFVLVLGLAGAAGGMLLQWWTSTEGYALVVSGKPFFSWPAFVPIMFECGVLGGASGALIGLLVMGKLPRLHHPLFNAPSFTRATDDTFFISIEAGDPRYDADRTPRLLEELGARHVEAVPA